MAPINNDINIKQKPENKKEIYYNKMIQMMNHYDYTPNKIDTDIIKQTYDDNTTLDEFIINMSNDINPATPSNKDSPNNKDCDDNPRPKAYGLFPMPEPRITESNKYNTIGNDIKTGEVSRKGREAPTKVSAAPSPPASAPACNVLNVVDSLHDVWHDVCADSGATEDVLNNRCGVSAINKRQVDDIILMGIGGEVIVDEVGDYVFDKELKTEGGLINNSCNMSCLSVPARCSQGWSFWAKDNSAKFISPTDKEYDFTLQEGLYKLNKQQTEDPDLEHMREVWMSKANKKIGKTNMNMSVWMVMIMLAMMTGNPTIAGIPGLFEVINKTKEKVNPVQDKKAKKDRTDTLYEHACKGHPYDPMCPACIRSRMTAKHNTQNTDDDKVQGSDKGAVLGIDYIGPYIPDVDGNVLAMTGVEAGRTNYGMVRLCKDKEASTSLKLYEEMRREYKTLSKDDTDIVRVHHDNDKSFEGVCADAWRKDNIIDTNTGGYNPQANSRVERRHRSIKELFKACMFMATGGLPYYYSLWGPGIAYSMYMVNINDDSDGRNYYKTLTGQDYNYKIGKQDLAFGQQVYYHTDPSQRGDTWDTPGLEAIWVGRSHIISAGHIIVPIEWDPDTNIYKLSGTKHVNHVRFNGIKFPLRMGPDNNDEDIDQVSLNQFTDDFFKPWYKASTGADDEQIDGEDPIIEVEKIISHRGSGKKQRFLTKWKGSDVKTYEPADNFIKHGGKELLDAYRLSLKKKGRKAQANISTTDNPNPPYTDDEMIVHKLIQKQNKKGEVADWIEPYKIEMQEVENRRLTLLDDDDITDDIRRDALPLRMILETKRDGRLKGRLVAIGYREPKYWDVKSNSSPVVSLSTVRALLFRAGLISDVISSVDVSVAFLQADPYPDSHPKRYVVYQPDRNVKARYYLLRGAIYGQRSASREWYDTLAGWLDSKGYKRKVDEPCAFINDKGFTILSYVDDLICRGSMEETIKFYKLLEDRFDCKDYNILAPDNKLAFLGFDITCEDVSIGELTMTGEWSEDNIQLDDDGKVRVIHIDQQQVIEEYLRSLDVKPSFNILSPMSGKYHILTDPTLLEGDDINKYQSIIGTLNYISSVTRYDIAYPTARLAQFSHKPTVGTMKGVNKVLQYLLSTQDFKLTGIYAPKTDSFDYYSDSDHAGDMPITTHSHTGTVLIMNNVPIQWRSKKQPKTSRSSAEAEIYALSDTLADARLLQWKMIDINIKVPDKITIKVDNNQAKVFANDETISSRLRTAFSLKEAWVQEIKDAGEVSVVQIPADINVSDMLTKVQPGTKVKRYIDLINPIKINRRQQVEDPEGM